MYDHRNSSGHRKPPQDEVRGGEAPPPNRTARDTDELGHEAVEDAAREVRRPAKMQVLFARLGKAMRAVPRERAYEIASRLSRSLGEIRIGAVVRGFLADTKDDAEIFAGTDHDVATKAAKGVSALRIARDTDASIAAKKARRREIRRKRQELRDSETHAEGNLLKAWARFERSRVEGAWWTSVEQLPSWAYLALVLLEALGAAITLHSPLEALMKLDAGEGWMVWGVSAIAGIFTAAAGMVIGSLLPKLRLTARELSLTLLALAVVVMLAFFPALEAVRDEQDSTSFLTTLTALLLWVAISLAAMRSVAAGNASFAHDETTIPGAAKKALTAIRQDIKDLNSEDKSLASEIPGLEKARDEQLAVALSTPARIAKRKAEGAAAGSRVRVEAAAAWAAIKQEKAGIEGRVAAFVAGWELANGLEQPSPLEQAISEAHSAPAEEGRSIRALLGVASGVLAGLLCAMTSSAVPAVVWLGAVTVYLAVAALRSDGSAATEGSRDFWLQGQPDRLVDPDDHPEE